MAEGSRRAFVCGHPIAHSRSPMIHGYWLEKLGLHGSYERIDVAPDAFPAFLESIGRNGFAGGNITIPHKEVAFRIVEKRDPDAEAIGAVNTIWFDTEGRLCGGNTDAYGFAANLDDEVPQWAEGRKAVVLGAGGAARAVIHALKQRGYDDIRLVNRSRPRAEELAGRFRPGVSAHGWEAVAGLLGDADLVVNTSSLGMKGAPALEVDLEPLPAHAVVADIVYVPLETKLLKAARARGLATAEGLGMLLHQAVPGFERWFGRRPTVSESLRKRIVADVEAPI
ncbi:shikimate dehydrogenase [Mesorhizobium koreense]|uniref:shikimate dehydrogenase n=1 Tax=Mesorhizobium koreense TaxID=3074855 RepID=UPI00287B8AA3|nr:shikimate dehydrogenase [Mesorhizobium sp. WR6]